jgi:uncharacterized protein (TIGR02466 family)
MASRALFVTQFYTAMLQDPDLIASLDRACRLLARTDKLGRAWSKEHHYIGYTSYSSLDDLPARDPVFDDLRRMIDGHVQRFAAICGFEPRERAFTLHNMWVNVMKPGSVHGSHIHPKSAISGSFYVALPPGSGALRVEDPRIVQMMAAPNRSKTMPEAFQTMVRLDPEPGTLYLWESWLRHDVTQHRGKGERISISFNYH